MSNKKQCTCDIPFSDCPNAMETPHGDKWYCTLPKLKEKMKQFESNEPVISERELERRYSKLEIKPAAENRFNNYICKTCNYLTKTVDVHHGVTPMFIRCGCCGNQAASTFYNDTVPDRKPEYEWRVPTLKELGKYKRNPSMLDHIFRGGLELFKIK